MKTQSQHTTTPMLRIRPYALHMRYSAKDYERDLAIARAEGKE